MPGIDPHVHRYFGYVHIFWKVEHFWLLSCRKNWEVSSSAFDVHSTRWRLLLKPMNKDVSGRNLCTYLERLTSDDGPDVVRAHWNVRVCNCERRKRCCCHLLREKEQLFGRGDRRHGELVEDVVCLSGDFEPFEADDLVIECKLVVEDPDLTSMKWWSEVDDEGLKSLSNDLRTLFQEGNSTDMVIRVGGVDVPAIKAILHARNKTLAEIIDRDISATVIELLADDRCPSDSDCYTSPAVNTNAVWQLVGYLHYGRLDEIVFGQPSVSVAECARILDVVDVIAHYIPDELTLTSGLDVEEHVVSWYVTEFKEGNDSPIASPTLIQNSSEEDGPSWRLVLYPRGKGGSGKHVAIYAEAYGGGEQALSKSACLEFAVADGEQNFRRHCKLQKPPGETFKDLGVDDFLLRPLKWEDKALQVVFRLRTSRGTATLSKAHRHVTSVAAFFGGGLEQLELLSDDLYDLFTENAVCCDFTIRCSGGYSFRVHRSIMEARARSFSELAGPKDELDLGLYHVTSAVAYALLSYIYSGRLRPADEDLAVELLIMSQYLGVDALERTCSRIMEEDRAKFVLRNLPSSQVLSAES